MYLSPKAVRSVIEALELAIQQHTDKVKHSHLTEDEIADLTNDAYYLEAILNDFIQLIKAPTKGIYALPLEYGSSGLPFFEAIPEARLQAKASQNEFTISGNKNGLLFLAHQLIGLANMENQLQHKDYHIHLDDLYSLNNNGVHFSLRLDEA